MATFLWQDIVFGPIHSRRVGSSLGINLLPTTAKVCTFDCIYCECGLRVSGADKHPLPTLKDVCEAIETRFSELAAQHVHIDSISFTGNGEPTLHPAFPQIIDYIVEARDRYLPGAKVSVFTNATRLDRSEIVAALRKADNPILKIDVSDTALMERLNRPNVPFVPQDAVAGMMLFDGDFTMQTMFVKGDVVDNSTAEALEGWYKVVRQTRPRSIMAYSIDRETPVSGLVKVSVEELRSIAAPLIAEGFDVKINA
ncbi:MAG: radical SAM protein [Bacteroidales bacterium]|nr:radical SAM protein [Bacteroidales bacterium]